MQPYLWLECDKGYFGIHERYRHHVMMVIEYHGSLLKNPDDPQGNIRKAPKLVALMAWAEQQGIDYKIRSLEDKPCPTSSRDDTADIKGLPTAHSPSMVIGDNRAVWWRINKKVELLKDAILGLAKIHRDLEIALIEALDNATNTVIVD